MSDKKFRATPAARKYAKEYGINLAEVKGSGVKGRVHEDDVIEYKLHGQVKISPLAAKIAEIEGLNVQVLEGTGPQGRIMKEDVLNLLNGGKKEDKKEAAAVADTKAAESQEAGNSNKYGEFEKVKMTPMRKVITKRMKESQSIAPTYQVSVDIDMTKLLDLRKQTVDLVVEQTGLKPSVTDYISLAVIKALVKHPLVNSSINADETEYTTYSYVNLGIAVGMDSGLMVPVVKNAEKMSFSELVIESKRVIGATVDGKLKPDEMSDSTFTISNLGMFGVDSFTSIINQPNNAILSIAATKQKPVVIENEIVVRPIMNITFTGDHRVIDGLEGAKFMQTLKGNLENPIGLLL